MARKPTPAGNTADTTPPAAAAAPVAAAAASPATAEQPAPETLGAAPSDAPAAADQAAPDAGADGDATLEMHDARVLLAYDEHQPDDIVSGTQDALAVLERDGKIDTHPDAVAYARTLKA